MNTTLVKKEILGVALTDTTLREVSEYIVSWVKNNKKKCFIVTPNPEIVVYCSNHPQTKELINEADIAVCDGVGLLTAVKVLGLPLKERITGVDLMRELCRRAADQGLSIGLLGGRGRIAEQAGECLREKYPKLIIAFTGSDWDVTKFPKSGLDILFVAYGFPKQEEWIAKNLPILPIKAAMGVGGALDYLSGNVMRAPLVIRSLGLEWLFRLIRQPWRIKRQLRLVTFVWLVLKEVISVQLKELKIRD